MRMAGVAEDKSRPTCALPLKADMEAARPEQAGQGMSRAGVPADHAERAIGHVIGGIRGFYDRYDFYNEKKLVFEALEGP